MDLEEAERRIAERVAGLASENVGVQTSCRPGDVASVHVWSQHPIAYWHAWVKLRARGKVLLPEPDDGCTRPGSPSRLVGTAATLDEAVDLVVAETEKLVAGTRRVVESSLRRPSPQPPVDDADLAAACALWQSDRDDGSSLVRGAARALTGIDHYFHAGFITEQEKRARRTPEALRAGIALLRGVNGAEFRDADGWSAFFGLPARGFAGRGLKEKSQDDQILKQLGYGSITMPLWGVSLDRSVADRYGTRFLFELVGEFPAVPAWQASGVKDDEQELVTGGRYRVLSMDDEGPTTHVRLEWMAAAGALVGSDPLLLDVLGAIDGVWRSELGRSGQDGEALKVQFGDYGNAAEIQHLGGKPTVTVRRQYAPEPHDYPKRYRPDEWSEYMVLRNATVTSMVLSGTDSIITALLRKREGG